MESDQRWVESVARLHSCMITLLPSRFLGGFCCSLAEPLWKAGSALPITQAVQPLRKWQMRFCRPSLNSRHHAWFTSKRMAVEQETGALQNK